MDKLASTPIFISLFLYRYDASYAVSATPSRSFDRQAGRPDDPPSTMSSPTGSDTGASHPHHVDEGGRP